MGKYYFLLNALPPLSIKNPPPISTVEMRDLLDENIYEVDKEKLKSLRQFFDLENIKAFFLNEAINPNGNFSQKELEEAIISHQDLPEYVYDFIDTYEDIEDRLKNYSFVWTAFFQHAKKNFTGFLYQYFLFEREVKLTLTALRSKYTHKDLTKQLQFEDSTDFFVAHLLAQKDMEDLEPDSAYIAVKELFIENIADPEALFLALLEYKFLCIEQMLESDLFDIDQVLGYYTRLILIEKFYQLKEDSGLQTLNDIIRAKV